MELSNSLAKEFASVTNDKKARLSEMTVYGRVSKTEEGTFIKIDGSDILTPATAIVSVVNGERVVATIKNHTATITGTNEDNPTVNSTEFNHIKEEYSAEFGQVIVSIDTLTEFKNDLQTGNNRTIIDGGCIKANTLNLTGCITFSDFNTTTQDLIDDIDSTASEALALAEENAPPSYIKSTYISSTEIRSPEITGNTIQAYGAFEALDDDGDSCGYFGSAYGEDGDGDVTVGVAIAAENKASLDDYNRIEFGSKAHYVIATNAGCRMHSIDNYIVVSDYDVRIGIGGSDVFIVNEDGVYFNGTQLA